MISPSGSGSDAGSVGDELLHGGIDESLELNLRHRPQAISGHADRHADDGGLRQRSVRDPSVAKFLIQPLGDPKDTAVFPYVFAQDDHSRVPLHFLC